MSRLLKYSELKSVKGISFSRAHLLRLEKAGKFPRRVQIGENSVAWDEEEIDAMMAQKKAARVDPAPSIVPSDAETIKPRSAKAT